MRKITCICFLYFLVASLIACQNNDRDSWQQPEKIMNVLEIKPGMIIGEPGAGEGYFTFKLSRRVGESGRIYANDIVEKKLKIIRERCRDEGINNITTILGKVEDPLFPTKLMDMVIMVYVFHDLDKPVKFLENIKPALKKGANLVIIERDPDKYGGEYNHFFRQSELLKKVKSAGYDLVRTETFLPRDNIYIFEPLK